LDGALPVPPPMATQVRHLVALAQALNKEARP